MMQDGDLIKQRLEELDAQYQQAVMQLNGLRETLNTLQKYAKHFAETGELNDGRYEMSNEAWVDRANETVKDLIKADRENFPTVKAVLSTIYIRLRDTYGVVIQQLRKDYRTKYDILRYPSALEAISDDKMVRSIFDSILVGLFPPSYFKDEALEIMDATDPEIEVVEEEVSKTMLPEYIVRMIKPIAQKLEDTSQESVDTFNMVCKNMDCNWRLLKTRYRNKHGMSEEPSYQEIISNNKQVASKFKRTCKRILGNLEDEIIA